MPYIEVVSEDKTWRYLQSRDGVKRWFANAANAHNYMGHVRMLTGIRMQYRLSED